MAGGFPCAALVGKGELMERFAQDVNHSGTFNSNVISMAASAAALTELEQDEGAVYRHMEKIGNALIAGIRDIARRLGVPLLVQGLPTAFHLSFTEVPVVGRGIWYLSAVHNEEHVAKTLDAVETALREAMGQT